MIEYGTQAIYPRRPGDLSGMTQRAQLERRAGYCVTCGQRRRLDHGQLVSYECAHMRIVVTAREDG